MKYIKTLINKVKLAKAVKFNYARPLSMSMLSESNLGTVETNLPKLKVRELQGVVSNIDKVISSNASQITKVKLNDIIGASVLDQKKIKLKKDGGKLNRQIAERMNRHGIIANYGSIACYSTKPEEQLKGKLTKKYIYVKEFDGVPKKENFQLTEEELPELKDGEFLMEAIYISVDPFLRIYSINVGDTMLGTQVAKIVQSRSNKFPVGKHVVGGLGWRTHTIWKDNIPVTNFLVPHLVPFEADVPLSLALGALGMPGNAAYFGVQEILQPKSGQTVVISAAAGAVGSHVGQIAKIKGCSVIGIAGSEKKAKWLKTLGFDHVINYKTDNIQEALRKVAPKGIDCYFDNVGGEISSAIIKQMNINGRIAVCGSISSYNAVDDEPLAPSIQRSMFTQRLKMEGFRVNQYIDRWNEGVSQNLKWIQEGKLKYNETITEGFENLPNAFIGIFKGDHIGKIIIKV